MVEDEADGVTELEGAPEVDTEGVLVTVGEAVDDAVDEAVEEGGGGNGCLENEGTELALEVTVIEGLTEIDVDGVIEIDAVGDIEIDAVGLWGGINCNGLGVMLSVISGLMDGSSWRATNGRKISSPASIFTALIESRPLSGKRIVFQ